jgi:hypothetical protein
VSGGGWIDRCEPAPPHALSARVRAVLGDRMPADAAAASDACVVAAESLLARLLVEGCTARDTALDLLTADALITYAFEAASHDPDQLDARAHDAMTRISSLAVRPPA